VEDKFLSSRGEMLDEIAMMLGGRVAEAITIGDITTGASNDIERTTKLARQMVTQYGMSDKLGPMTLGEGQHEVFLGRDFSATPNYSQEIAFEIDKEVRSIIDGGYATAERILTENRALLDQMADVLVERETVDKDELEALLEGRWDEFLAGEAARKAAAEEEEKAATRKSRRERKKGSEEAEAGATEEPTSEPPATPDGRPILEVPEVEGTS